ncbi:hypothetical protein ACP6H9_15285 [Vibrio harveyi]|uniref:hypothetical protein n=1 Tax=Vibrio harveyi TaxID=669 RepID=UPI003CF9A5E2
MSTTLDTENLTVLRKYEDICPECKQPSEFLVFVDSDNCRYDYCGQCSWYDVTDPDDDLLEP